MPNKTLAYLNTKAWYRFIKVIFSIFFVLIFSIYNFIVFSDGISKVDNTKTFIQCNTKDKKFFTASDLNLFFTKNDFQNDSFDYKKFFGGFNDYKIKSIITACNPGIFTEPQIDDIYDVQKAYEVLDKAGYFAIDDQTQKGLEINAIMNRDYLPYKNKTGSLYGSSKITYLDFSFKIFDLEPGFTNIEFLKYFFIGNTIILLILLATRHLFYYIVLGKLNPKI